MRDADLKIESSEPPRPQGGQIVGMGFPGIRVTHVPTGIHAVCDSERSQLRNKRIALAMVEYGLAELGWKD